MTLRKTLACLVLGSLAASAVAAQTADELIEKCIQAKGGRKKLASVQTLRMSGTMSLGPGTESPVTIEMVPASHKFRMDFHVRGTVGSRVTDGSTAWQYMPFLGQTEPEALTADELREMKLSADFKGPLYEYKAKGGKAELLGKEDLGGKAVFKLKLTQSDGKESTHYLDAVTHLEVKKVATHSLSGQTSEVETSFSDFKTVEGLTLPFTIEARVDGQANAQVITLDKIEVNPQIPASRFDMPKVEKKEEAPPPAAPGG